MAMNIVVCVKQTPASTSVAIDSSGKVKTEGVPHAMNPFDEYAVEEALRIKEKAGDAKVFALTLGEGDSEQAVRSAIALGATDGICLSDPAFAGSDTYGVSYLLAQAVKKIAAENGGVHLVLFGKQTNDGESGHTTAETAAWLEWPSAVNVRKIPAISDKEISVERLMEDGADTIKAALPAVIGVTKEINEPRLPSLKGKMAAKKAQIQKWGAADIAADAAKIGAAGAKTEVIGMSAIPSRPSGTVIPGETPEEKARTLVEKLKEQKFI